MTPRVTSSALVGSFLAVAVVGQLTWQAPGALAVAGDLDPAFGSGGQTTTRFASSAEVNALARQGRKIVAGGWVEEEPAGSNWALARYRADGSLDRTFGAKGRKVISLPGEAYLNDLVVLPNDKILAVGSGGNGFRVVRLTADGRLDKAFGGGDGIVGTSFGQDSAYASQVARVSKGRFVVAGSSRTAATGGQTLALARYDRTGRLDPRFGNGGKRLATLTAAPYEYTFVSDLLRRGTSNRVLVVGTNQRPTDSTGRDFLLAAFTPRGNLDSTFGGGDGYVVEDLTGDDRVGGAAILPGGAVMVGGYGSFAFDYDSLLMRFTAAGTLDTDWGGGAGWVRNDSGNDLESWTGLARSEGRFVLVGRVGQDAAVRRFLPSGATDADFGSNADGLVVTPFPSGRSALSSVVVLDNGKVVAGGYTNVPTDLDVFALERLRGS